MTVRRDLVGEAAERTGLAMPSSRTELRKTISTLCQRKLTASARIPVRRWASAVVRTDDELAAKVAELLALGDLPPRKGN